MPHGFEEFAKRVNNGKIQIGDRIFVQAYDGDGYKTDFPYRFDDVEGHDDGVQYILKAFVLKYVMLDMTPLDAHDVIGQREWYFRRPRRDIFAKT